MSNEGRSPGQRPPRTFPPISLSRRTLGAIAAGLASGGVAGGLGWLAARTAGEKIWSQVGLRRPTTNATKQLSPVMHVHGASMVPTLLGIHAPLQCDGCGARWSANWQPELRPVAPVTCWNCGAAVAIESATALPGTAVQVEPFVDQANAPASGDLVAIWLQQSLLTAGRSPVARQDAEPTEPGAPHRTAVLSVKRVVAVPGQRLTHENGRLLVNGVPPNWAGSPAAVPLAEVADDAAFSGDKAASGAVWIPVHDDAHRRDGVSWWQPSSPEAAGAIHLRDEGFQLTAGGAAGSDAAPRSWLLYHHRAVHNSLRPDRVRDDVPANVSEVRGLLPVERLRLSLWASAAAPWRCAWLQVAFWDGRRPWVFRRRLGEQRQRLVIVGPRWSDCAPAAGDLLSDVSRSEAAFPGHELGRELGHRLAAADGSPLAGLSHTRPVALGLIGGNAIVSGLRIDRPVTPRIDLRRAAALRWPLVLGRDEYFVLGDNLPLSIDSRHFGPVHRRWIVGLVRPVG